MLFNQPVNLPMKTSSSILLLAACITLAACSSVKQGVVISRHARRGMHDPVAVRGQFRYAMPEVCWIEVEGLDKHGRKARRNVILFRNDWEKIRVGDFWSAGGCCKSRRDSKQAL